MGGEEVELGLRVLREEIAQKLMDDSSLVKQLRRSRGEHDHDEVMVSALSHVDVEVGAIVRALLESKRRKAVSSSHARTSHRHRSSDRHRSRHRLSDHHSRRKSRSRRRSRRESPSRGRRRSHHDGAKDTTRDREVDRYVAEKDDHHKSKRHPRGAEDVAEMNTGSQSTGARTLNSEADLESWLRGLDPGRGIMLQYRDALKQEFGDLAQVAAAVVPGKDRASVLSGVGFRLRVECWRSIQSSVVRTRRLQLCASLF